MINFFKIFLVLLFTLTSFVESLGSVPIEKLLNRADELYRSKSSHVEMTISVLTEDWERTMKVEAWSKGQDYTLLVIRAPKKDAGVSTLKRGNEMWNFFPKINKVIKIPPSMMMGSWMGTDFTNDDLVKSDSFVKDFERSFFKGPDVNKYYVSLIPKENVATVWAKVEIVFDKKTLLPISQSNYNERGEKIRTMSFSKVKMMGGKSIPTRLELISHNKPKNKTIIEYSSAKFNLNLKESFFSKRNLEKRR